MVSWYENLVQEFLIYRIFQFNWKSYRVSKSNVSKKGRQFYTKDISPVFKRSITKTWLFSPITVVVVANCLQPITTELAYEWLYFDLHRIQFRQLRYPIFITQKTLLSNYHQSVVPFKFIGLRKNCWQKNERIQKILRKNLWSKNSEYFFAICTWFDRAEICSKTFYRREILECD